jgi:hypothetical protein
MAKSKTNTGATEDTQLPPVEQAEQPTVEQSEEVQTKSDVSIETEYVDIIGTGTSPYMPEGIVYKDQPADDADLLVSQGHAKIVK